MPVENKILLLAILTLYLCASFIFISYYIEKQTTNWKNEHDWPLLQPDLLGPDIHREIIPTDLPYIFIVLGEFVRRSKQFPFGDHFINSYNLNSCLYIDIVRKNLILVTLGT